MKSLWVVLVLFTLNSFATTVNVGISSNFSEVSTGSSNPYGGYFKDGIVLAIEKDKKKLLSKGISIKLQEFDYGTSDIRVLDAARKAIDSNVIAVVGYNYSSNALMAASLHNKAKLPMISPSASANMLGDVGKYVHLGSFNNTFMSTTLSHIARKDLKAKKAVIISASNCAYCADMANSFQHSFEKLGGVITGKIEVLKDDKDFTRALLEIAKMNFDIVFIPNQELTSARIISALAGAGIQKPMLGGDGWGNVGTELFSILGSRKFEGYSVSHWHNDLKSKETLDFNRDYKSAFNKTPNDTSVLAYDSMRLLIQAILKSKSLSREGIESALNSINYFEGVTGKFLYKPNKAPRKSLVLLKANNRKFAIVRSISPKEEDN